MTLPHLLKRIRLQLARSKEFPMGSRHRGYEFGAPLDAAGHIDPALWHKVPRPLPRPPVLGRRGRADRPPGPQAGRRRARPLGVRLRPRPGRRRRSGLSLRLPRSDTRRVCVDPRRGRRDAHLSGGVGAVGVVTAHHHHCCRHQRDHDGATRHKPRCRPGTAESLEERQYIASFN